MPTTKSRFLLALDLQGPDLQVSDNLGAFLIAYTILGVPYYNYSIIYPQSPILIIQAPILDGARLCKLAG